MQSPLGSFGVDPRRPYACAGVVGGGRRSADIAGDLVDLKHVGAIRGSVVQHRRRKCRGGNVRVGLYFVSGGRAGCMANRWGLAPNTDKGLLTLVRLHMDQLVGAKVRRDHQI